MLVSSKQGLVLKKLVFQVPMTVYEYTVNCIPIRQMVTAVPRGCVRELIHFQLRRERFVYLPDSFIYD